MHPCRTAHRMILPILSRSFRAPSTSLSWVFPEPSAGLRGGRDVVFGWLWVAPVEAERSVRSLDTSPRPPLVGCLAATASRHSRGRVATVCRLSHGHVAAVIPGVFIHHCTHGAGRQVASDKSASRKLPEHQQGPPSLNGPGRARRLIIGRFIFQAIDLTLWGGRRGSGVANCGSLGNRRGKQSSLCSAPAAPLQIFPTSRRAAGDVTPTVYDRRVTHPRGHA
jgi:hypothetical protein